MKETLKKLRTENRYSQDLLAKILGISRLSYTKYESGEVVPPVEIVRKLAKIYKVSYKTLIDNELKDEHPSIEYADTSEPQLSIESPVPSYGSQNFLVQFASMLSELQNTIAEMQNKLDVLQNGSLPENSFQKSRTFNKTEFFSKIGNVQIDSSYIDELRSASLI